MTIINLDVTLRDGGYRNNFGFSLEYVIRHAQASVAAGFDWVEIAYRGGSVRPIDPLGLTGRGDDDLIAAVAEAVGAEHVAMILHPKNITEGDLPAMYDAGARLVRVCVSPGQIDAAVATVEQARSLGFTVGANFTRASALAGPELVQMASTLSAAGADVIYLADSNGSLLPPKVAELIRHCRAAGSPAVGVHAHNNLGLALANSIAAVEAGATWADSSVLGMGKGPGNLVAEHWTPFLLRSGRADGLDLGSALQLARDLERAVPEATPALALPDVALGHFDLPVEARSAIDADDLRLVVQSARALCAS